MSEDAYNVCDEEWSPSIQPYGCQELHKEEGEEATLAQFSASCKKNPEHKGFIPVYEFNAKHLPEYYQEDKYVDYIKICSDLTVRIGVGFISTERPRYFPGTENPYIAYEDRGKYKNYNGSGMITRVIRNKQNKSIDGKIWINTACHVVFDKSEAAKTSCRLFFDNENDTQVIKIQGCDVYDVSIDRDFCTLICETSDGEILQKLETLLAKFEQLYDEVYRYFRKPLPDKSLYAIVSHPHGVSKYITFGDDLYKKDTDPFNSKLSYNISTCSGSSGAHIIILGVVGWYNRTVHAGTSGNIVNYSSTGHYFLFDPPMSELSSINQKSNEALETESSSVHYDESSSTFPQDKHDKDNNLSRSEPSAVSSKKIKTITSFGNEKKTEKASSQKDNSDEKMKANFQEHSYICRKNPGHLKFISIKDFTLDDLPEDDQDSDLLKLIKCLADLTIKVDVRMISPQRPTFSPHIGHLYPLSDMKGERKRRSASGLVFDVVNYIDSKKTCICRKCQQSGAPSSKWWEFVVFTATHVVFDDTEANDTHLTLFFDDEMCETFILDQVKIVRTYVEEDVSFLTAITCECNIAEKLCELLKSNKTEMEKVYEKYHQDYNNSLAIMISHPHGCSKKVSVGNVTGINIIGKFLFRYRYTTCSCPGSSGALVYLVNKKHVCLHLGTLKKKINVSGFGFSL